jgi:hypothetical protein
MKEAKEAYDPEQLEQNAVWDAIENLAKELKKVRTDLQESRKRLERVAIALVEPRND